MPFLNRREFCFGAAAGWAQAAAQTAAGYRFRYVLSSCLYGTTALSEILPEVRKAGAEEIDIWPRIHGNQREQIEEMGRERFREMLQEHGVRLGILTHYDLGPFTLQDEMRVAHELGGRMVVCMGSGPKNLSGDELRAAVREFAEKMKPHIAAAEDKGVMIAIENHGNNLIESPDAVRWLAEFAPSRYLGIALAPYHLPQGPHLTAKLIGDLGERLVLFYAWQHGRGATEKLPKEQELEQLPGRGPLDFGPIVGALARGGYRGWVSIFMHPTPRGIPILPEVTEVTAEINRSRRYLESLIPRGGG
jgi:sugar phosphate isomerase/epimerase